MSKDLLNALRDRGLLEYGSVIKGDDVREILGVEYPEYGTKKDFDEVALAELGAIDYVRNVLLGEGKFITSHQGDYRILLPSENRRQVDAYIAQADRKLRRAQKLSRNTPNVENYKPSANADVRIAMKMGAARNQRRPATKPAQQPAAAA
jgi:hypothetical protein